MRKLLWNGRIGIIALLFVVSNAQETSAQQQGLEQAREAVSATGRFGERSNQIKPRMSEENTNSGVVTAVEYGRPIPEIQARRLRRVRRDPTRKLTKLQTPPGRTLPTPRAVFQGGLELAREPDSPTGAFGERSDAPGAIKFEEEENRPGVVRPTDYDPSISIDEARRLRRVRRDPARRVTKGRRPR